MVDDEDGAKVWYIEKKIYYIFDAQVLYSALSGTCVFCETCTKKKKRKNCIWNRRRGIGGQGKETSTDAPFARWRTLGHLIACGLNVPKSFPILCALENLLSLLSSSSSSLLCLCFASAACGFCLLTYPPF